jgi:hypothetical protein
MLGVTEVTRYGKRNGETGDKRRNYLRGWRRAIHSEPILDLPELRRGIVRTPHLTAGRTGRDCKQQQPRRCGSKVAGQRRRRPCPPPPGGFPTVPPSASSRGSGRSRLQCAHAQAAHVGERNRAYALCFGTAPRARSLFGDNAPVAAASVLPPVSLRLIEGRPWAGAPRAAKRYKKRSRHSKKQ